MARAVVVAPFPFFKNHQRFQRPKMTGFLGPKPYFCVFFLGGGWGNSLHISSIHTAYRWGFLHFRYLRNVWWKKFLYGLHWAVQGGPLRLIGAHHFSYIGEITPISWACKLPFLRVVVSIELSPWATSPDSVVSCFFIVATTTPLATSVAFLLCHCLVVHFGVLAIGIRRLQY